MDETITILMQRLDPKRKRKNKKYSDSHDEFFETK